MNDLVISKPPGDTPLPEPVHSLVIGGIHFYLPKGCTVQQCVNITFVQVQSRYQIITQ